MAMTTTFSSVDAASVPAYADGEPLVLNTPAGPPDRASTWGAIGLYLRQPVVTGKVAPVHNVLRRLLGSVREAARRAIVTPDARHVVATCYPMAAADKATLAAKGIAHVYLGEGFATYCARREAETVAEDEGL